MHPGCPKKETTTQLVCAKEMSIGIATLRPFLVAEARLHLAQGPPLNFRTHTQTCSPREDIPI